MPKTSTAKETSSSNSKDKMNSPPDKLDPKKKATTSAASLKNLEATISTKSPVQLSRTPNTSSIFNPVRSTRNSGAGGGPITSTPQVEISEDDETEDELDSNIVSYVAGNNDRFACIIERMDKLERENRILKQEKEKSVAEANKHIHETYEKEIAQTRKLVDELAGQKAETEISQSRLIDQLKEANTKNNLLSSNVEKLEANFASEKNSGANRMAINQKLRRELDDVKQSLEHSFKENKRLMEEKKDALTERDLYEADSCKYKSDWKIIDDKYTQKLTECDGLKKRVDDLQKACELEAVQRVEFQNKLQSAQEQLEFEQKVHAEEMAGVSGKSNYNHLFADDAQFQQAIQEMRDEYDFENQNVLAKVTHQYQMKISAFEKEVQALKETVREREAALKNAEITTTVSTRGHSTEIQGLKRQIDNITSELESARRSMATLTTEKKNSTLISCLEKLFGKKLKKVSMKNLES